MPAVRKALITEFGDESKVVVVSEDIAAPSAAEVQIAVEFPGFPDRTQHAPGDLPVPKKRTLSFAKRHVVSRGKITERCGMIDLAGLLQQLGTAPATVVPNEVFKTVTREGRR